MYASLPVHIDFCVGTSKDLRLLHDKQTEIAECLDLNSAGGAPLSRHFDGVLEKEIELGSTEIGKTKTKGAYKCLVK
jgi:hypothetical protein